MKPLSRRLSLVKYYDAYQTHIPHEIVNHISILTPLLAIRSLKHSILSTVSDHSAFGIVVIHNFILSAFNKHTSKTIPPRQFTWTAKHTLTSIVAVRH